MTATVNHLLLFGFLAVFLSCSNESVINSGEELNNDTALLESKTLNYFNDRDDDDSVAVTLSVGDHSKASVNLEIDMHFFGDS